MQLSPLLLLLVPALAGAAPLETAPVARDRLPDGVVVRGAKLEQALAFRDKAGAHYLVLSSTGTRLFVDDWLIANNAKPISKLPVRDLAPECEMGGVNAQFHPAVTAVTDLDRDGLAEVTFAYELACRSDVSPSTYKLLVLENGAKYILRGTTRVDVDGNGTTMGGEFTPDPAEARWPAAFLAHAKQRWATSADDVQTPPHRQ